MALLFRMDEITIAIDNDDCDWGFDTSLIEAEWRIYTSVN